MHDNPSPDRIPNPIPNPNPTSPTPPRVGGRTSFSEPPRKHGGKRLLPLFLLVAVFAGAFVAARFLPRFTASRESTPRNDPSARAGAPHPAPPPGDVAPADPARVARDLRLEFLDLHLPSRIAPGETVRAQIILKNASDFPLPSASGLSLGYRWQDAEEPPSADAEPAASDAGTSHAHVGDGYAKRLPDGLPPGGPAILEMEIRAPEEPRERWFLRIAPLLVAEEERTWLDSDLEPGRNATGRWVAVGDPPAEPLAEPSPGPMLPPFVPEDFQSKVRVEFVTVELPEAFKAGAPSRVRCVVRNDSPFALPASDHRAGLGYHWSDPDGTGTWNAVVWDDGNHVLLETPLDPGRRNEFEWEVTAPPNTGEALVLELGILLKTPDGTIVWGPGAESHVARVRVQP